MIYPESEKSVLHDKLGHRIAHFSGFKVPTFEFNAAYSST